MRLKMIEEKTIEDKLIEKGIHCNKLSEFAMSRDRNYKKDIFKKLVSVQSFEDLKMYEEANFLYALGQVLQEKGLERNYKESIAFQKMASEMLKTLNYKKYKPHEFVGLNIIYRDTIKRLEKKDG